MYILKQNDDNDNNCIVISYKCIGINTFNIVVFDLETLLIKYWHEGFQLWESQIKGFLLETNDYLILSKAGINMVSLGKKETRKMKDRDGLYRRVHSLGSMNFLKVEPCNHLFFSC